VRYRHFAKETLNPKPIVRFLLPQAALGARRAWLAGAAAQAAGLERMATAVLALERSCQTSSLAARSAASDGDDSDDFAEYAALLARLAEAGPRLSAAERQVRRRPRDCHTLHKHVLRDADQCAAS